MVSKFCIRSCSIILTLSLLFILPVLTLQTAQAQTPGAPDQKKEKTVEQVKKNIKVLTGMPASQLNMVMDDFATSLGVRCQHCHVQDNSGWQFEKDDIPAKGTARKMIQMVIELNSTKFGGRSAITCFTCHHGSREPAAMIPLPPSPPAPVQEEKASDMALPTVQQILTAYETALGGKDAVGKITSRVSKGVSVDLQGKESPIEILQKGSDRIVTTVTAREGMTFARGFNGTNGWMTSPRGSRELPPDEKENFLRQAALFPSERIEELASKLHVNKKESINGAAAYCLSVPLDEYRTENYYLDSATGLLLRDAIVTQTMIGNIPEQTDYSDYRTTDGIKVPFVVRHAGVDPRDVSTFRFTTVEQNVTIDDNKFDMPKGKK